MPLCCRILSRARLQTSRLQFAKLLASRSMPPATSASEISRHVTAETGKFILQIKFHNSTHRELKRFHEIDGTSQRADRCLSYGRSPNAFLSAVVGFERDGSG